MTREEIKNTPELVDDLLDDNMTARSREKIHKRLDEVCNLAIKALEQEPTYCPKFRNQQEKQRVFHTLNVIEKYFSIIGNDDDIDDILILKDLVQKMEVEE